MKELRVDRAGKSGNLRLPPRLQQRNSFENDVSEAERELEKSR